ncbi:hypothetical protein HDU92_004410 [Lobulomyces angularis]|nr:hypothetical protein HDU92_004410 [Lobulomyces angularis]
MVKLSITPLPDETQILIGNYGIDHSFVRGIARVDTQSSKHSIYIDKLLVRLKCSTNCSYYQKYDLELIKRERTWWDDEVILLKGHVRKTLPEDKLLIPVEADIYVPECISPGTLLEIPFEIPLPDPVDNIPLIPPLYKINSSASSGTAYYEAANKLEVILELHETFPPENKKSELNFFQSLFFKPRVKVFKYAIPKIVVWDPRIIPKILFPETKNWRSSPGAIPCEYDFEIYNSVVGPGDDLIFSYRIAIASEAEKEGVRSLQSMEARSGSGPSNSAGNIGSANGGFVELSELRRSDSKAGLLSQRIGRGGGTGDGLYAESEASIRLSSLSFHGKHFPINSSTPKMQESSNCLTLAAVDIKHSIRVDIEFRNIMEDKVPPERLAFECNIIVGCVGKRECLRLLEDYPELVPPLDYDKICGTDIWMPKYEEEDPVFPPNYVKSANHELLEKNNADVDKSRESSEDEEFEEPWRVKEEDFLLKAKDRNNQESVDDFQSIIDEHSVEQEMNNDKSINMERIVLNNDEENYRKEENNDEIDNSNNNLDIILHPLSN